MTNKTHPGGDKCGKNGEKIQWAYEVKYLGVTVDDSLN